MRESILDKALKEVSLELVGEVLKTTSVNPFYERVINSYAQDVVGNVRLMRGAGVTEAEQTEYLLQHFKDGLEDRIIDAFVNSSVFSDSLYKTSYEKLRGLRDEGITYEILLLTEIYGDEIYLNEIFVRLVEEDKGVAITSAGQLQELTGVTEIYGDWDKEKWEIVYDGGIKPTKEKAQETAKSELEDTFTKAMSHRYCKALNDILEAGGTYSELLQVKPSYFNLPQTWSGCLETDQYSSILWAIEEVFLIGESSTSHRPDLKTIAEEIQAPYSVLMDAHKLCNKWKLQT